jgi:hypothetical protein
VVQAGLINQLDLQIANFIIGARPVFGCSGRGSVGTANGCLSDVVSGRRQCEGNSCFEQANSRKATPDPSNTRHFRHLKGAPGRIVDVTLSMQPR